MQRHGYERQHEDGGGKKAKGDHDASKRIPKADDTIRTSHGDEAAAHPTISDTTTATSAIGPLALYPPACGPRALSLLGPDAPNTSLNSLPAATFVSLSSLHGRMDV